jgi:hypothetical protein
MTRQEIIGAAGAAIAIPRHQLIGSLASRNLPPMEQAAALWALGFRAKDLGREEAGLLLEFVELMQPIPPELHDARIAALVGRDSGRIGEGCAA